MERDIDIEDSKQGNN
jgi:hypothetical protein